MHTCHYWYFLDKEFKFQSSICSRFHDVSMVPIDVSSIVILNTYIDRYYCIIAVVLLELTKRKR